MIKRAILILVISLLCASQLYSEDKTSSKPIYTTVGMSEKNNLTPFPIDDRTQKIIKRHKLEDAGWDLAKQGLYEEAIVKFKAATNPAILNYDYEKNMAEGCIVNSYKRQGKFEKALRIVNERIKNLKEVSHSTNEIGGYEIFNNERLELLALIEARDTKNNKPIYDHINNMKTKYAKFLPPNGYMTGFSSSRIDDLIHLYDYMHDYYSGIAFMDEIIKYHTNHKDSNHRSAHKKDVVEYTRVKHAWELDKQTGQHGHLQDVIKTSDFISW